MRSFWIWFIFLGLSWIFAFLPVIQHGNPDQLPWRLGSSAIFFTAFFLSPLYRAKPAMLFVTLLVASLFSMISLWPTSTSASNPYILLVYSILAGKAVYRLASTYMFIWRNRPCVSNSSRRMGENSFVMIWDFSCCLDFRYS